LPLGLPLGLPLEEGRIIRAGQRFVSLKRGFARPIGSALPLSQTGLSETSHSFFTLPFFALIAGPCCAVTFDGRIFLRRKCYGTIGSNR